MTALKNARAGVTYLSNQGVESPNFKVFQRVSIAVEALLQRGPGALEPPNESVERLVSHGPHMGIVPEHEKRERAVALVKAVETAAANGLSAQIARDPGSALERFSARPSW